MFNRDIIKTGLADPIKGSFLKSTEDTRLTSDYSTEFIDADAALNAFKESATFVDHIESRLDRIRTMNNNDIKDESENTAPNETPAP